VPIKITYRTEEEIENILADARNVIEEGPSPFDLQHNDACWGAPYHSKECRDLTEHFGVECKSDSVIKAEARIRAVSRRHWLKEGIRRPSEATIRSALGGMTQEAFVYKILHVSILRIDSRTWFINWSQKRIRLPSTRDNLCESREIRGIHVALGWDTRSILRHLKVGLVWVTFAVASTWFGTFIWAERFGDWGTALAFGQLLAASIAIVMLHT
jgi:hypothetical protein